jgi:succinate-semialdehyde dehydrogenase/glutarate-semialdehyde dehydrogenase
MVADQKIKNDKIISYNPSNLNVLGEVAVSTSQDIAQAVNKARQAQKDWQALGVSGRIKHLRKLYDHFVENSQKFALLETQEMGRPIDGSIGSIAWGLERIKWNLDNAEEILAPETTYEDKRQLHQVHYEPYGVFGVITPWNFPLSNFIMGALQPLLAGNTVVYKSSEEVPMCGQALSEAFRESGIPEGVFNQVYGAGDVGEMIARSDIDFIHFTGSSAVGKKLYKIAAEKFIPVTLELGGSDAGIIFEDAVLSDSILESIFWAKFVNCGQICCGLKRLLVHESRVKEVTETLKNLIASKKLGDTEKAGVVFGPLAAKRQQALLVEQIEDAKSKGANIVMGGKIPEAHSEGAYYEPTLITGVTPDMRIYEEEVFGPVLPIYSFKTEEEAIAEANRTIYGLSSYIFTEDTVLAKRVATQLDAGEVNHNDVDSCPANPFGGYKSSGMGRTGGKVGLYHACQVKMISLCK